MAKRKTSDNQGTLEFRERRTIFVIERTFSLAALVVRWAGIVAIAYLGFRCVDVLAGRTTVANVVMRFFANAGVRDSLSLLVGGGGAFYGWRQKVRRRDDVKRLHPRVKELEGRLDPGRSSSGLTRRGETRPEDE